MEARDGVKADMTDELGPDLSDRGERDDYERGWRVVKLRPASTFRGLDSSNGAHPASRCQPDLGGTGRRSVSPARVMSSRKKGDPATQRSGTTRHPGRPEAVPRHCETLGSARGKAEAVPLRRNQVE